MWSSQETDTGGGRNDGYLAMGLLIATVISSLFGFAPGIGKVVAALGQTAFLLFGAALLLVLGHLWFLPENRDRD